MIGRKKQGGRKRVEETGWKKRTQRDQEAWGCLIAGDMDRYAYALFGKLTPVCFVVEYCLVTDHFCPEV